MKRIIFAASVSVFAFLPAAHAQVSSNFGGAQGGAVVIGESSTTCDGTIEGAIRYSSSGPAIEFCDGASWTDAGGITGACEAPASCPNVGDVCSDGSLFAGFTVYDNSSCEPLYVTNNNQSTSAVWKTSTGTDDISTDDHVDGQVNHANRGGTLSNFPAFDLCESNTYHGKSDWYLPSRVELDLLWRHRAAIDANAAGNFFTDSAYWSSTEYSALQAWAQHYNGSYLGQQHFSSKTDAKDVRCVRRD